MKRVILALIAVAATSAAGEVKMPGPAGPTYARADRAAIDDGCRGCHASVTTTHDASLHARAFRDGSFQRGYAIEPRAFCRSCHAPEDVPHEDREPDAFARERGVTCVTCHLPSNDGAITTGGVGPSRAPHRIERAPDFGTRACAGCHEFSFPGGGAAMQETLTEHRRTKPDVACSTCHMERANDLAPRDHAFPASRDLARLSAVIDVDAKRTSDGTHFKLTSNGVGHAFPTGDLFRRVVLRVRTERGTIELPFQRSFAHAEGGRALETRDTRLAPSREIDLPGVRGPLTWSVAYQRVTSVGQTPPFASRLEAESILATGVLP